MSSKNKNINNEVSNNLHFDNLQVDGQKELEIILTTSYKCSSFLKGYHAYQNMCDPVKEEFIQAGMEPMNLVDKYAATAIRGGHAVGLLKKRTNEKFANTIFYFLQCDENNRCWVEFTGKRFNHGFEKEMQVPCMLHFDRRKGYTDRLKSLLLKL